MSRGNHYGACCSTCETSVSLAGNDGGRCGDSPRTAGVLSNAESDHVRIIGKVAARLALVGGAEPESNRLIRPSIVKLGASARPVFGRQDRDGS